MIDREINELESRWGVSFSSFSKDNPLSFRWNGLDYCLESSKGEEEFLIMSLSFPVASYDKHTLMMFLSECSVFNRHSIEFSVGFAKDRIMLLTKLSSDISAMDIENSVLNLKSIYDKVINGE